MENSLRQSVRGQDEALNSVANAVRMQRAGLNGDNRPLVSNSPKDDCFLDKLFELHERIRRSFYTQNRFLVFMFLICSV